jgi:hypothetical protein
MQQEPTTKPVMDVTAPPRPVVASPVAVHEPPAAEVDSTMPKTDSYSEKTKAEDLPKNEKKQSATLSRPKSNQVPFPTGTVVLTVLVMVVLSSLAVLVYLQPK